MDQLLHYVKEWNGLLTGPVLMVALVGVGIYFAVRLRLVQVRSFKASFKDTFGGISFGKKADKSGMSSFQSLATAIAAQVGTGNLAGAATAIAAGGPGAIFWMWLSAFLGLGTIYAEATAAQKYKYTTPEGETLGGPVYYIMAGIKGKPGKILAKIFAVCIILALGFFGIMVQSNSIGASFKSAFHVNPLVVGIIIAVIVMIIVLGGVGRIASVTEKMVPLMAGFYIIGALVIVLMNIQGVPEVFRQIFVGAFDPSAVMGGAIGVTIKQSIRYGVARGLFSNEAGMGSTPHAHALAKVDHPCRQGSVAMMGVFIDTFVILTLTALVIILAGSWKDSSLSGITITQDAFTQTFHGFGSIFIAICMLFFALSTIIGWYFFAQLNVKFLAKKYQKQVVVIFSLIVAAFIVLGSVLKVELVWELSDMFNSLMVLPNLIGLLAVSGVIVQCNKEYEKNFLK